MRAPGAPRRNFVSLSTRAQRDPLFAGLAATIRVNQNHADAVDATSIPAGSPLESWASTPLCDTQVLAAGEHARGVQFHPEFKGAVIAGYIDARRERLASAGVDVDERIATAADCPDGARIMANFRRHFVDKG